MTMRSTEFDILKGLMMITVVMGHAGVLLPWNIEFSWFRMLAFFMVTGYFTKELYGDNATLRRKAERLLVPWLAYSVLMYVLFRPEPLLKNIARTLYAGSFNVTFYSYPWWFVNAMMVALILFSLLNRVKIGGGITALACYILIHISFLWEALPIPLPWSIDNALGAMVYIYVGWRMKEYVFRWTHLWVLIIPVLFIWINWHFRWHYHLNMKDMHFENALLDVVVPQSFTFSILRCEPRLEPYSLRKSRVGVRWNVEFDNLFRSRCGAALSQA